MTPTKTPDTQPESRATTGEIMTNEHEASDPIKTPVRYVEREATFYDSRGQRFATVCDSLLRNAFDVGLYIEACINERPQLLAETLRLRQEVERLSRRIETYRVALADAIRSPLGVCPDSAVGYITEAEVQDAEIRRVEA